MQYMLSIIDTWCLTSWRGSCTLLRCCYYCCDVCLINGNNHLNLTYPWNDKALFIWVLSYVAWWYSISDFFFKPLTLSYRYLHAIVLQTPWTTYMCVCSFGDWFQLLTQYWHDRCQRPSYHVCGIWMRRQMLYNWYDKLVSCVW